jgi:hypothetical protein
MLYCHSKEKQLEIYYWHFFTVIIMIVSTFLPAISSGQYISHYVEKDRIKIDTLIDKTNGVRFIIDKKRINIKALDKLGKVIWKTDPSIDNKIPEYRVKKPIVVYFAFRTKEKREVIVISYSNSQFGYIDKKTGKFHFEGQD